MTYDNSLYSDTIMSCGTREVTETYAGYDSRNKPTARGWQGHLAKSSLTDGAAVSLLSKGGTTIKSNFPKGILSEHERMPFAW